MKGRTETSEMKVTPAMIEAGYDYLRLFASDDFRLDEDKLAALYSAMSNVCPSSLERAEAVRPRYHG